MNSAVLFIYYLRDGISFYLPRCKVVTIRELEILSPPVDPIGDPIMISAKDFLDAPSEV